MLDSLKISIIQFLLPTIVGKLKANKDELFKQINDSVDIPMIDEKAEAKVFESLFNIVLTFLDSSI